MPNVDAPVPSHFCWIELATTDPDGAIRFYTSVFDWTVEQNDMGPLGFYYLFKKNGRSAAAMYKMMADQQEQGIPPNWLSYVAVRSADDAAARARELGAQVIAGPFDAHDYGRMAIVQDAQGAVLAVWEAKKSHGAEIRDENDTLCWNELATTDADAACAFYPKLFGWTAKVTPQYTEWHLGERGIGGLRVIGEGEPTPPNWIPYIMVASVDGTLDKVAKAGGQSVVPPMDLEGVGRFAVIADPAGAMIALYQPSVRA